MSGKSASPGKVDPVTFEVLRHRLWAINDEQGTIAARISGSPAIYEVFDFNVGILTAAGKGVFTGVYIAHHAIPLEQVVSSVKERFGEDMESGDMFFTNDPWCGALHANDGALAAPVFWDGEIVCWTAIVMHDMDVGGPVAGSFVVGARECFGEAPLYPPIKLVKQDILQEDIYSVLRRNCRSPEMNYLNMKARISSQIMTRQRIHELIGEYGRDTFVNVLEQIIDHTKLVLESRLSQIPDGVWWEHGYLDHDGITNRIYKLVVKLTKKGTRLIFDFSGTDPQAIGSINCTSSGLRGGVLAPLMSMLCYDLPWSTGALNDIVEIKAEEGTINNARFPAGCSMASTQGAFATQNVASNAIAKMLCCSSTHKKEAQACWAPYWNGVGTSGQNQRGEYFVQAMTEGGGGGGGARTFCDGIDGGGMIHSLSAAIPNVETNEYIQPVVEIYRRYCPDTCGYGMWRGGSGLEYAYTPMGTPKSINIRTVVSGVSVPGAPGLFGGYPPSINTNVVLRQSDIFELFQKGTIPMSMHEIQAATEEILPAKIITQLMPGDVQIGIVSGGSGYGDPLKRDPEMVCRDVANSLVTEETAGRVNGVVLKAGQMTVDYEETARLRHRILAERKKGGRVRGQAIVDKLKADGIEPQALKFVHPVSDFLEVRTAEVCPEVRIICCSSCGTPICSADANIREYTARSHSVPMDFFSSVNSLCPDPGSSLIEYFCPSCGTLLSVDIVLQDETEMIRPDFILTITKS